MIFFLNFKKKVFLIFMFNFLKKRLRIFYKLFLKEVLSIMDMCYLLKINKFKIGLWFMVFFIMFKVFFKDGL